MIGLKNGMLVQHASLGLGKVVAVEPTAVHVVFATNDARVATKLRLPMALSFLAPPTGTDAWLSGLSGFALDPKTGRYGRATTWLSHADAVARFTLEFPRAFEDPTYLAPEKGRRARAARWRRAHAAFVAALGEGRGERLLADGNVAELVERALKVERMVGTIVRDAAKAPLVAAREAPAPARRFFAALFDLLSAAAPGRGAFEALAASVAALAGSRSPESSWPAITVLPFVARPDVHMLLRPQFACDGAQRLGLELAYEATPGWATYESLLASTRQLLEKLRPLGAQDHIDVEAFMHSVLAAPARARPRVPANAVTGARARAAAGDDDGEADGEPEEDTDAETESDADHDGESGARRRRPAGSSRRG